MVILLLMVGLFCLNNGLGAQTEKANEKEKKLDLVRIDASLGFSRFEQQIKSGLDGARGERLVENFELGLLFDATHQVFSWLSVGLYTQFDVGNREAATFAGFDSTGAATTAGRVGGRYSEFWLGPLLRFQWRMIFAEFAYGAIGVRHDTARSDLPNQSGNLGDFRTHPGVAYMFAVGWYHKITENLALSLRMQYRIRYYNRRGSEDLQNNIVHGTQNYSPFIGLSYALPR